MCDYEIGDKVVCADGKFFDGVKRLYKQLPVEGQTYVVRDIRIGVALGPLLSQKVEIGEISVLLVGVVNDLQTGKSKVERGFAHWRFVKLDEWKQLQAACREAGKEDGIDAAKEMEEA